MKQVYSMNFIKILYITNKYDKNKFQTIGFSI